MATNVYQTANSDINIKYENDIDTSWTVLDAASNAYDFANKTDSDLNIYDYAGGNLMVNIGEAATSGLSYASNVITWKDPWADINLPIGFYYYEVTYEDSGNSNPTVKLIDGILQIE